MTNPLQFLPALRSSRYFEALCKRLDKFRPAEGGSVLLTFALATIPLVAFVGSAVDYSRGNSAKVAMQAAIDSTALMLSKDAASLTSSQFNQKATAYFAALFNRPEVRNVTVSATYTTATGAAILISASGKLDTTFMRVMGIAEMGISADATIKWGNKRLRLALVLDNTGSMSSANKMPTLKTATKNLLTQLKNVSTQNGDVYVSIIPFSKDVNVDPVNFGQNWVKWSGASDTWNENNGSCSKSSYSSSKTNCTSHGGNWTPDNHNTWNGCVTDRDQSYDTLNTAPTTATPATLFPAEQYSSCPVALMGLSYDWIALNTKIDAMQPNGNTNQAIGLQWGWQSLTSAPFTVPPKDPNYKYQDAIILLTDGLNTQDRWYTSQSSIDARQKITCDNVKAAGTTLYTVQVNTSGDPTSTLLQNCASDPSKFFLLTSASQILTTFNQIGAELATLRVAK
jgi:Flp pilus assembly protein TadG